MSNRRQPRPGYSWDPASDPGPQAFPGQGRPGVTADTMGDRIKPFLVSGGATAFVLVPESIPPFDPRAEGIQLVASQYVPFGNIAWVKQIRVGPYIPPVLQDPWDTSGVSAGIGTWREFNTSDGQPAAANGGIWRTPMAWESYFDVGEAPPVWEWHLRIVSGDVRKLALRPPFSPTVPQSWNFLPNVPVPRTAYSSRGLPGTSPAESGFWGPNRMQATPDSPLMSHAQAPEDTTICLFTTWKQSAFTPRAADMNGVILYDGANVVYPLLPSYGQLHGYMQSVSSEAAEENAIHGWGG